MKISLPKSYYNNLSYIGTIIAAIAVFMFVFLYVLSSISTIDRAYTGIVIFIIIPAFIILGLLLIPIGMIRRYRREKREGVIPKSQLLILDLNQPRHRNATIVFVFGSLVFLFLSALGSYEAYHYTESVKFCGLVCHTIMKPEYTAYNQSPHARVSCAECHIGSGADWYVKSKLSGLYQVYAAVTNKYPRPIPTPVRNLRPARETCEQCHWPEKIYGKQQRREIYILPDENNTRWEIDLLMNTGGGNPAYGLSSGIHWHINPDIEIEYVTTDRRRLTIPQVILHNKISGETTVFNEAGEPFNETGAEWSERRTMDCIDCHNRPSHRYKDPGAFVNTVIAAGEISPSLPKIKLAAVEACMQDYPDEASAEAGISEWIETFYQENYPAIAENKAAEITQAISSVKKAYSQNIFPVMKVKWEEYPDHIGHMTTLGCNRCHDGRHSTADGRVITDDCRACHIISSQGVVGQMTYSTSEAGLDFIHPVDIEDAWKEMACSDCHSTPPVNY